MSNLPEIKELERRPFGQNANIKGIEIIVFACNGIGGEYYSDEPDKITFANRLYETFDNVRLDSLDIKKGQMPSRFVDQD